MLPGNTAMRPQIMWPGVGVFALGVVAAAAPAGAQSGPPGITTPKPLAPFDSSAPAGTAPPGLKKMLAFSQDTRREFMQGVDQGLAAAAKDRGLHYRLLVADSDAARQGAQVRARFRGQGSGGCAD